MCGVFAYIGNKTNAADIILEGLKTLEYRGYDSWGIAVQAPSGIAVEKHMGKIGDTEISLPQSSRGIGHTRWATHGGVTVENSHPHLDCTKKIALLHNGIVENFADLKKDLSSHTFLSQTDTEIVVHLIEELCQQHSFSQAVLLAFKKLQGLNALVVMHNDTGEIVAVKHGSPLVVGVGEGEYFIASDVTGILPYTHTVMFLNDDELVSISDTLTVVDVQTGKNIKEHSEIIAWDVQKADKGAFQHFMLKEIFEQPSILDNLAMTTKDRILALAKTIADSQETFFIGAGTAYNASLAGTYLFSKIAKLHVNTTPASEFNYLEDFLHEKSLVIALSQSGETIDIVEPMIRAKQKKATLVSVINSLGSTLYRMSDEVFLLGAGPEKAVASTKAYTAKLATLVLLTYALIGSFEEGQKIVLGAAAEIQRLLANDYLEGIQAIAKKLQNQKHLYTIGRGYSYPNALEAALKIKEVSYIHAEGLAGGELKHGPIALIEEGTPCIVFAPNDATYDAIISNATEIKARGGYIIGVASQRAAVFDEWIEVKDTGVGALIADIVPMQLLAYYLAVYKNLDPDKPRNLAKSVTVK